MQVAVACRHRNLLDAGLVARAHFVSARRPCLHMLNVLLRRSGRTQGESRGAQTERGDRGKRQHNFIHDVLLVW